ncbi:hypothetical protein Acr_00g0049160 [Actinidia rufa]|uniref:Uncharacterized protein n=1 Tax=Actinidia rufa TaxID=165716 RepID=A0A7J0DKG7_9ERIC|nr:hypothetical protein Acr_00g0049160 [Actinidia rufa]
MRLVSRDKAILSKHLGGLGISSVKSINATLLLKCSKMYSQWKDILCAHNLSPQVYDSFRRNLVRKIGDGRSIKFWTERSVGNSSFQGLYPRLYNISILKEGYVFDMYKVENGVIKWELPFRRSLFEWEQGLFNELMGILNSTTIDTNEIDFCGLVHRSESEVLSKIAVQGC